MTILHNNFSLEGAAEADCLAIGLRGNHVRFGSLADIQGPYQLSGFCVRCFGAIFRAGSAHIVLLGPVGIAQRTPDSFPDPGCVLQMFSDPCHRRMTKVAAPRLLISNQSHLNGR